MDTVRTPLDVWFRFYPCECPEDGAHLDDCDDETEYEANTYKTPDGFVIEHYHTAVGLVSYVHVATYEDAVKWYEAAGYQDFSSGE